MLETKIEELTKAVIALTELIGKIEAGKTVEPVKAEKPVKKSEPVVIAEPVIIEPLYVQEVIPVMPAAPTFEPACPTHDGPKAPFTDGKGLIDYVMTVYKELGAEKGAQIQGVLTEMGLQNVNELRPTEYDAFFAKVEALK